MLLIKNELKFKVYDLEDSLMADVMPWRQYIPNNGCLSICFLWDLYVNKLFYNKNFCIEITPDENNLSDFIILEFYVHNKSNRYSKELFFKTIISHKRSFLKIMSESEFISNLNNLCTLEDLCTLDTLLYSL